jgi:hypothetical protein
MVPEIVPVLFVRPNIAHGVYLHNVNIISKYGSLMTGNLGLISDASNLLFAQRWFCVASSLTFGL